MTFVCSVHSIHKGLHGKHIISVDCVAHIIISVKTKSAYFKKILYSYIKNIAVNNSVI